MLERFQKHNMFPLSTFIELLPFIHSKAGP